MASRLKKLLTDGQVIEGTLTRVTAGSAAHYQLTSKERGKTKTVYSTPTLFWTVAIGFIGHLHSRNQMDSARLEDALLGLVRYLIRGRWFDEARVCEHLIL